MTLKQVFRMRLFVNLYKKPYNLYNAAKMTFKERKLPYLCIVNKTKQLKF